MVNNFIIKYGKVVGYILFLIFFLMPNLSKADFPVGKCSTTGYTVATINGINTNDQGAKDNMVALSKAFGFNWNGQNIDYEYLLNQTHLAGLEDPVDTIVQGIINPKSDYDLVEMLNDASSKIKTQKVLLVGHSQGNFYANNFYAQVADQEGGIPKESIRVYAVATPANNVAGNIVPSQKDYTTSDTDLVIRGVAGAVISNILPSNVHIGFKADDDIMGHDFAKVYLKYQADKIVSDIQYSLGKLKENDKQLSQSPCISPPKLTTIHKIEGVIYAVADPTAELTKTVAVSAVKDSYNILYALGNGIINTTVAIGTGIYNTTAYIGNTVHGLLADVNGSLPDASSLTTLNPSVLDSLTDNSNNSNQNNSQSQQSGTEQNVSSENPANGNAEQAVDISNPPPGGSSIGAGGDGGVRLSSGDDTQDDASSTSDDSSNLNPILGSDTTAPDAPTIATLPQYANTDNITVTGTAEIGSTITISGGSSTATGVATDGNYSISVPLNKNILNTLSVTATDAANNTSDPATVSITHDNIPPAIDHISFSSATHTVVAGGVFYLTIFADSAGYSDGGITVNGAPVSNFDSNGERNFYTVTHNVVLGEPDRMAGTVPASIVLTDEAGNSNVAYTVFATDSPNIDGHEPASVAQVLPAFTSDGKFTQDVVLPCVTDSGYFELYSVKDSDSTFHPIQSYNWPATAICTDGHMKAMSGGTGFADFSYPLGYYQPIEGWYYGIISKGDLNCGMTQANTVCDANKNIQSFFRLHQNAAGVWSDTDSSIPLADTTPPVISALSISSTSVKNDYVKIGGVVNLSITADAAGYTAKDVSINNVPVTNFKDNGDGTYAASYIVSSGDNDITTSGAIPVSVSLSDASRNYNTAYTTVATNNLKIDAHAPTLVSATVTAPLSIDVQFSETIYGNTVDGSGDEFTVSKDAKTYTVFSAHKSSDRVVTLTLASSSEIGVGENPQIIFSSLRFEDMAGNEAISPATVTAANIIQ